MRLSLPLAVRNVSRLHVLVAFFFVDWLFYATTPSISPLHTSFFSSVLLWMYGSARAGHGLAEEITATRARCWGAGAFFALGQLCQRAAGDVSALWWSNSLLPAAVLVLHFVQIDSDRTVNSFASPSNFRMRSTSFAVDGFRQRGVSYAEKRLLLVATAATLIVLANPNVTAANIALGLCSTTVTALGCILVEDTVKISPKTSNERNGAVVSANGSLLRRVSLSMPDRDVIATCYRDCFFSLAVCNLLSGVVLGVIRWEFFMSARHFQGLSLHAARRFLTISGVGLGRSVLLVLVIAQSGSYDISLVHLSAVILAQLQAKPTLGIIFSGIVAFLPTLCASAELLADAFGPSSRHALQSKRIVMILGTLFIISSVIMNALSKDYTSYPSDASLENISPVEPSSPYEYALSGVHPVKYLTDKSAKRFDELRSRQSRTLSQAVAEYKRRYHMPPPPHFDQWFEMAAQQGVQLIDEFDTIYDALLPFWSLKPATIRARVTEALGFENNGLIALMIREGRAVKIQGGPDWQRFATLGMIKDFVHLLPDMDIAFNVHDEPRVVVPNDELNRMVDVAKNEVLPEYEARTTKLRNSFSKRPKDLNNGKIVREAKVTRFNEYAHQQTWGPSRLSCSLDSPARSVEDNMPDNITTYALGELGFVYNHTAFSDICNSPSFRRTYGFFDRPNAFKISHELVPIFSQSKISSFQDILYPSPWYWSGAVSTDDPAVSHMNARVEYLKDRDMPWALKDDKLWWRGSTTGGFSRAGGWRRQHRQIFVKSINGLDTTSVMHNMGTEWQVVSAPRQNYSALMDVAFSHVGQCDPGDCDAQREFFHLAPGVDMQDAWRYKYLLDIDGNAFSGRFYAFLHSASLVYKMAIFREWHHDWLLPWAHYVPLSLQGKEHFEAVRYFAEEPEGQKLAPKLAGAGQRWAGKVLRSVDLEMWMFRLLLEYGRVIDDERDSIGFTMD